MEKELTKKIKCQQKLKGDFFLKQGQVVLSLFMLEEGLVRSFYVIKDKEINSWFGFENIILGSIMPLFYKLPSSENIQFLENSIMYSIDNSDLNELYNKYNDFTQLLIAFNIVSLDPIKLHFLQRNAEIFYVILWKKALHGAYKPIMKCWQVSRFILQGSIQR